MRLEVLTLNLWGVNEPVRARMRDLGGYLRRHRPDIVALQEVEAVAGRSQAEELAETAGYRWAHVQRSDDDARRGEGLAVLTTLQSESAGMVRLPDAPDDHPRALQQVDVVLPDGSTHRVANTHLCWRLEHASARQRQAEAIAQALTARPEPVVLLGDLNDVPGSPPLRVLHDVGLVDALPAGAPADRPTYAATNPYTWQRELLHRRIDHVLCRGLRVLEAQVVLDGITGPVVSDHFGVAATLTPDGARRPDAPPAVPS